MIMVLGLSLSLAVIGFLFVMVLHFRKQAKLYEADHKYCTEDLALVIQMYEKNLQAMESNLQTMEPMMWEKVLLDHCHEDIAILQTRYKKMNLSDINLELSFAAKEYVNQVHDKKNTLPSVARIVNLLHLFNNLTNSVAKPAEPANNSKYLN